MQPAPNFSEAGGPRRRLPMIQRRKFPTGRTRLFLSSPAWLPVNPNRKSLTKTLSASEAWGVLLTRRDDYLPVNLLYRHRQAGGVNLAGDHSLFIDLCSLHRSLLERDVTFALTFVPRGRIRQIGRLKDSVQAALLGRFCFWSKAEKRERLLKSDGWTFEQFAVWDPQREPVGDVVRRGDARQAVRFDARDLLVCVKRGWLRGKDTFPFYYPQTVLSLAVMDPPEVAGRDQVVDMHIPQRGAVLCLVFAEQPLELS